nr:hypothetical protein [Planomonospora parontospora]
MSSVTSATSRSPGMIEELFQSAGSSSVEETAYLAMALTWSA